MLLGEIAAEQGIDLGKRREPGTYQPDPKYVESARQTAKEWLEKHGGGKDDGFRIRDNDEFMPRQKADPPRTRRRYIPRHEVIPHLRDLRPRTYKKRAPKYATEEERLAAVVETRKKAYEKKRRNLGLPIGVGKGRRPLTEAQVLEREKQKIIARLDREIAAAKDGRKIKGRKRKTTVTKIIAKEAPPVLIGCVEPGCPGMCISGSHFCKDHQRRVVLTTISEAEAKARTEEAMFG